jgi:hypothetical protein
MQEHNKPTAKTLREFGLLVGGMIAGLFGAVFPFFKGHALPWQPWLLGGILAGLGLVQPQGLAPLYRLWMKLGLALGWLNSRIILGLVFFAIVTPMALIMRLIKRDTMAREWAVQQATYRIPSRDRAISQMEKPY